MKYMRFFVFISLMTMVLACNNQTDKTAAEKSEKKSLETSQEPAIPVYDTFSFHAYDITASYLAGTALPDSCEGADSRVFNEFWERYADAFDKRWKQYREQEMLLIQSWCRENLNVHDSVFYPFSGPDFNYLNIMFPDAVHSVLIGLEKPGSIPAIQDMQAEKRQLLLEKLNSGMQNNLKLGFFRTLGMKEKLNEELLNGTIPVMMVFLKRHGYELL